MAGLDDDVLAEFFALLSDDNEICDDTTEGLRQALSGSNPPDPKLLVELFERTSRQAPP